MVRKILVSLLLIGSVLLGGCWSRNEIEDLGIISMLGIDRVEVDGSPKTKISALVLRPPQLGGGGQQSPSETNTDWLVSEVGNSMNDAVRNIGRRSPRSLVLYHNSIIVISEEVAREGVKEVLDFLQRHKDIRTRNWILISRSEAQAVMKTLPEVEDTLAMEINEILTTSNPKVSETLPVDLNRFTQDLVSPGRDAVAAVIGVISPVEPEGNQRGEKEPAETIHIEGLAVFRSDKLVGFLTPQETKGLLYVLGRAQSGVIPVDLKERGKVSFMMRGAKTKYKPTIKRGKMVMELTITANGDVIETDGDLKVGDPKVLKSLEKDFNKAVQSLAIDVINKAQKDLKADIFGFGSHIHLNYPKYWKEIEKDWPDLYPDLPVTVKVKGDLRKTANIGDPMEVK